jgi:hypothetical protein
VRAAKVGRNRSLNSPMEGARLNQFALCTNAAAPHLTSQVESNSWGFSDPKHSAVSLA